MIKTISNLPKIKITKDNFSKLSTNPGVYIFWRNNKVVYVGKAVNLKKRLSSYLQLKLDPKTSKMISSAESLCYIKVENELEALLLESYLIKKYQPKYNIIAKDDKSPLYIKITKEKYPRVITARKIDEKENEFMSFYGPFPSSKIVKQFLKILRRAFYFSDHKITKKPCIYSQIGLCNPCPSLIEQTKDLKQKDDLRKRYISQIKTLDSFLKGNYKQIQNKLYKKMLFYSSKQMFEKANELKKQLDSISYITQPVIMPKFFSDNPNLTEDIRKTELSSLQKILQKISGRKINLERIECYDISHISGVSTAASMVVFINAEEDRKNYRHFKIKQKNSRDDLSSLEEVAKRRIKHLETWGKPDLIVVDGGITQTKTFNKIFSLKNIPVIGIAKRFETLIIPKKNSLEYEKFVLPNVPAKKLIQRIRDEAHRFAQRYHHKMFKKMLLNN